MTFEISDLRARSEFFDAVADRIWRAWWEPRGVRLDDIRGRLAENLNDAPLPVAMVAHREGQFLGTASLIESDLEDRPKYTPWVAAVWTEPDARGQGVGRALVAHACDAGFALGYSRLYLCAPLLRRSFYLGLGWTVLEEDVGLRQLTLFMQERPTLDAARLP